RRRAPAGAPSRLRRRRRFRLATAVARSSRRAWATWLRRSRWGPRVGGAGRWQLAARRPPVRIARTAVTGGTAMVAPLEGIRVVEVANWLAAPSAGALMA